MDDQSVFEKTRQQKNIDNMNNANNVRIAAQAAKNIDNPYAKAIGHGISAADKLTGGKVSERLGKSLTAANKMAGLKGRMAQNALNKMSESGASDKIGSALAAKKGKFPNKPGSNSRLDNSNSNKSKSVSKETLESGDGETKLFEMPKIVKIGIVALIPTFVFVAFVALLTGGSTVYIKSIGLGNADSLSSADAESKINKKVKDSDSMENGITDKDLSFNYKSDVYTFATNKMQQANLVQTSVNTKYLKRKYSEASLEDLEDFYPSLKNLSKEYDEDLVYDFFFKMYSIYTAYRDTYDVVLDLPLLMSTLYLESDDINVIFNSNLSDLDRAKTERKKPVDDFDYFHDWSGYISTPTSSVHDMEILAQHMVSQIPYDPETRNCNNPKDNYCYVFDEDKYKEFLKEFIEKKYFLENTPFGSNDTLYYNKEESSTSKDNNGNADSQNYTQPPQADGEWRNWRQCKGEWKNIKMPNSKKTICNIGCLITSLSIQIVRSGTATVVPNVNPGVVVNYFEFASGGRLYWNSVSNLAPNFVYRYNKSLVGMTKQKVAQILSGYDLNRYYLIIGVSKKDRTKVHHYVAFEYADSNGELYMVDPSSDYSKVYDRYKVYELHVYEKKD